LSSANNLVVDLAGIGAHVRSRPLGEDTLAAASACLATAHPDTLSTANNLARLLRALREAAQACRLAQCTLTRRRDVLHADHASTLSSA
jgi:hypothetical protein